MAEDDLNRVSGDLAVLRQAMGLRVPFGGGTLAVDVALAVTALFAAGLSVVARSDAAQVAPFAAIAVVVLVALYARAGRAGAVAPAVVMQVVMSVTIYVVVFVAAAGYAIARDVAPEVSSARLTGLYVASVWPLLAFTALLVRSAVRTPERHYGLGLAVSTGLAGMVLPLLGRPMLYVAAHVFMAIGFAVAAAIQFAQLRRAADVAD